MQAAQPAPGYALQRQLPDDVWRQRPSAGLCMPSCNACGMGATHSATLVQPYGNMPGVVPRTCATHTLTSLPPHARDVAECVCWGVDDTWRHAATLVFRMLCKPLQLGTCQVLICSTDFSSPPCLPELSRLARMPSEDGLAAGAGKSKPPTQQNSARSSDEAWAWVGRHWSMGNAVTRCVLAPGVPSKKFKKRAPERGGNITARNRDSLSHTHTSASRPVVGRDAAAPLQSSALVHKGVRGWGTPLYANKGLREYSCPHKGGKGPERQPRSLHRQRARLTRHRSSRPAHALHTLAHSHAARRERLLAKSLSHGVSALTSRKPTRIPPPLTLTGTARLCCQRIRSGRPC